VKSRKEKEEKKKRKKKIGEKTLPFVHWTTLIY
jgi:hypothetical protein